MSLLAPCDCERPPTAYSNAAGLAVVFCSYCKPDSRPALDEGG